MNTRIASGMLALIFLASGSAKLATLDFEVAAFERWGYTPEFMYLTGLLEVAGGIGVLIKRLSALAAACLAALMLGAVLTHLQHGEWPMLALASSILALAVWRAWVGRQEILALFGKTRRQK
mgnify:CR=1 FL=1